MTGVGKPVTTITLLEDERGQFYARVIADGVAFTSGPWTTIGACLEHVGRVVSERRQQNRQVQTDPRAWVV